MKVYEPGDYIKVDFEDAETGESEWMWVRVESADEAKSIVFGYLAFFRLVFTPKWLRKHATCPTLFE